MSVRGLGGVAAVFVLALAVHGCGGDDSSDSAASGELEGNVRWTMLDYDPQVKEWASGVVRDFEAANPGVQVEVSLPPVNSYQQLLTTQVRGKNPPDLAGVPTAWVPAFANAGALASWREELGDRVLNRIDDHLLEGAEIDGELFALPYLSTSRALFFNEGHLEKAGVSGPPSSWDELLDAAARIKAGGAAKHPFALQGTGNEAFAAWFPYVYWSYGGELADGDGNLTIDPEACESGLAVLHALVEDGFTQPNPTASDTPEQLALFTSGDAAMTITGPWLIGMLAAENENLEYGVAPIPAGTESTTLDVQDAFILFKDGGNSEAAVALAEHLFEPKVADELVSGRGMLPTLEEGFAAPRYGEPPLSTFVELVRDGKFVPSSPDWPKLTDRGARALQAMYTDGQSAQETCEQIAAEIGG